MLSVPASGSASPGPDARLASTAAAAIARTEASRCRIARRLRGSGTRAFAEWMNPVIRGWMNYYGKFYSAEMSVLLRRINTYLVRWFAGSSGG